MIIAFLKNQKTFLFYAIWGCIAAAVNIGTFLLWLKLGWHYQLGNVVAWFTALLVTYFSNKFLVFDTPYHGIAQLVSEFGSFLIARLMALGIDIVIIWVGIKVLNYSPFLVKVIDNIVVGIANYIVSRWLIFTDKRI